MNPLQRTRAVLRSTLPSTQRLVLIALMDYADALNEAWPSVRTLQADTGFGDKAVRRALLGLVEAGVLTVVGERNQCRVFRLVEEAIPARGPVARTDTSGRKDRTSRSLVPVRSQGPGGPVLESVRSGRKDRRSNQEATREATMSPLPPKGGNDEAYESGDKSKAEKAQQTREHTAEYQRLAKLRSSIVNGPDHGLTTRAGSVKPAKGLLDMYRKIRDRGVTEDGIRWLVMWALLAPDTGQGGSPRYLRSNGYTDLKNLLVDEKADARIEKARRWYASGCPIGSDVDASRAPDEVKRRRDKPVPVAEGEIPEGDLPGVVLDIGRQLREGVPPIRLVWPGWLDVLDNARIYLTDLAFNDAERLTGCSDRTQAFGLLEVA